MAWYSTRRGLRRHLCLISMCGALAFGNAAHAQFTSSVEGTVKDSSGAAVPGADVTLTDTKTGVLKHFTTKEQGYFDFATLPPSTYTVTVVRSGFKTTTSSPFAIEPMRVQTVPVTLDIGATSETVQVSGEAPLVQLADPIINNTIDQKSVEELPFQAQNVLQAAAMTPGVQGTGLMGNPGADIFNIDTFVGMAANGAANDANMYYIDGTANLDNPSGGGARLVPNPESVGEMTVSAMNYSAQYGRGNGVVTDIITRAGANQFHGSLFEYHGDNDLTARTIYQNQNSRKPNGRTIPVFRRNEFGGSIGGPIVKDHTFFYFTIDQLLQTQANAYLATVETPQFLQFLQQNRPNSLTTKLLTAYPAATGAITTGLTTAGQIAGVNCATVATLPDGIPCSLPVTGQAIHSYTTPHNGQQISIRIDQDFSQDRFYGSYYRSPYTQGNDNIREAFSTVIPEAIDYGNFNYTHTFTPDVLNEFSVGGTRSFFQTPCAQCQVPLIGPGSGIPGFGTGFAPVVGVGNDFTVRDTFIVTKGTHTLRAGAEIFRDQDNSTLTDIGIRPNIGFLNALDFADSKPHDDSFSFNPVSGGVPNNNRYYRSLTYGFYVQDQWKVRPNLTISPGLRWDFSSNPTEAHKQLSVIRFPNYGAPLQQEIAQTTVVASPRVYKDNRIGYFAPRLSFAWDPFGKGKTSVRGGFGIFFNRGGNFLWTDTERSNPPFLASINASTQNASGPQPVYALCDSPVFPYNCHTPNPPTGLNPDGSLKFALANVGGPDQSLKQEYSENFFLGVQHQLPGGYVLEVDYTGSNGRHLYSIIDRNRYSGDKQQHNGLVTRINPHFGAIRYVDNSNVSSFNGMDIAVKKQFSRGLNLSASYDYSKAIDLMSAPPGANKAGEQSGVYDAYNLNAQRGRSALDLPHKFAFNTVWEIAGPHGSELMKNMLGGWELSGLGILQSGLPADVITTGADYNGDGNFFDKPNMVLGAKLKGFTRQDYMNGKTLNINDFYAPTAGTEGNAGRNTVRGPGFAQVDAALSKNFSTPFLFGEQARFQIRGDFFNLFNRVNLTGFNTNLNNPAAFGHNGGVNQARTIQIAAKMTF